MEFLDFLVINVAQTRFKAVIYAQTQQASFFYVLLFIQYLNEIDLPNFMKLCVQQKPYKILILITIKFQYLLNCLVDQTFAEETTKESKTYYHLL